MNTEIHFKTVAGNTIFGHNLKTILPRIGEYIIFNNERYLINGLVHDYSKFPTSIEIIIYCLYSGKP